MKPSDLQDLLDKVMLETPATEEERAMRDKAKRMLRMAMDAAKLRVQHEQSGLRMTIGSMKLKF